MTDVRPARLTAETFDVGTSDVCAHDHAVAVFRNERHLRSLLSAFVDEGVARSELTVFIHSFASGDEAWGFLSEGQEDAQTLRDAGTLQVHHYTEAFQGDASHIDPEHVLRVVGGLQDAAKADGRVGVRIFVDASRSYFQAGRVKEWFDFEAWLGRRLSPGIGLVCGYLHADAMREDIFPRVLETHAYRFDA